MKNIVIVDINKVSEWIGQQPDKLRKEINEIITEDMKEKEQKYKPDYQLEISLDREDGEVMYYVIVYDINHPVNYHSYNCEYFKKGRIRKELIEELKKTKFAYLLEQFK